MPKSRAFVILLALLAGCDERERLTFPSNVPGEDDVGPITTIEVPASDSFLTEGDPFIVAGRTVDPSGVDTVYFEVVGSGQAFLPAVGGGQDTVAFGLPIPTIGRSGGTIIVRVRGVDVLGNRGPTAVRQLAIE